MATPPDRASGIVIRSTYFNLNCSFAQFRCGRQSDIAEVAAFSDFRDASISLAQARLSAFYSAKPSTHESLSQVEACPEDGIWEDAAYVCFAPHRVAMLIVSS